MSKFWGITGITVIIAVLTLVTVNAATNGIHFTDLETKCVYEDASDPTINFQKDNKVQFYGSFDYPNVKADLDYDYTKTDDRVVLNIVAENGEEPENFRDTCLGQVIYDAETEPLPEGRYLLQLEHNGEKQEEMIVRTR